MISINYLKTHRKGWALSQEDLGGLIGRGERMGRGSIYRLEEGLRSPSLRTALACEVMFDVTPGLMFPDLYDEIETVVLGKVERMHREFVARSDVAAARNVELLLAVMERAKQRAL